MPVLHLMVGSGYLIGAFAAFGTDWVQILESRDHDFHRPDHFVQRAVRVDEFLPELVVQRMQCLA